MLQGRTSPDRIWVAMVLETAVLLPHRLHILTTRLKLHLKTHRHTLPQNIHTDGVICICKLTSPLCCFNLPLRCRLQSERVLEWLSCRKQLTFRKTKTKKQNTTQVFFKSFAGLIMNRTVLVQCIELLQAAYTCLIITFLSLFTQGRCAEQAGAPLITFSGSSCRGWETLRSWVQPAPDTGEKKPVEGHDDFSPPIVLTRFYSLSLTPLFPTW